MSWIKSYWSHYIKELTIVTEWPESMLAIKLSKELIYVIIADLIKNAVTAGAEHIEISVNYESTSHTALLSVTDSGTNDDGLLQAALTDYWKYRYEDRYKNGLGMIVELLAVLHSAKSPPVRAERVGSHLRVICRLALT